MLLFADYGVPSRVAKPLPTPTASSPSVTNSDFDAIDLDLDWTNETADVIEERPVSPVLRVVTVWCTHNLIRTRPHSHAGYPRAPCLPLALRGRSLPRAMTMLAGSSAQHHHHLSQL
jgi:hypothetical protein